MSGGVWGVGGECMEAYFFRFFIIDFIIIEVFSVRFSLWWFGEVNFIIFLINRLNFFGILVFFKEENIIGNIVIDVGFILSFFIRVLFLYIDIGYIK